MRALLAFSIVVGSGCVMGLDDDGSGGYGSSEASEGYYSETEHTFIIDDAEIEIKVDGVALPVPAEIGATAMASDWETYVSIDATVARGADLQGQQVYWGGLHYFTLTLPPMPSEELESATLALVVDESGEEPETVTPPPAEEPATPEQPEEELLTVPGLEAFLHACITSLQDDWSYDDFESTEVEASMISLEDGGLRLSFTATGEHHGADIEVTGTADFPAASQVANDDYYYY